MKSKYTIFVMVIPVLLVALTVTAVVGPPPVPGALIGSDIIVTLGDLSVGDGTFVVTGATGNLMIGPNASLCPGLRVILLLSVL